MKQYKVGDTVNGYIIAVVHEYKDYFDLELFDEESGEKGFVRVEK